MMEPNLGSPCQCHCPLQPGFRTHRCRPEVPEICTTCSLWGQKRTSAGKSCRYSLGSSRSFPCASPSEDTGSTSDFSPDSGPGPWQSDSSGLSGPSMRVLSRYTRANISSLAAVSNSLSVLEERTSRAPFPEGPW